MQTICVSRTAPAIFGSVTPSWTSPPSTTPLTPRMPKMAPTYRRPQPTEDTTSNHRSRETRPQVPTTTSKAPDLGAVQKKVTAKLRHTWGICKLIALRKPTTIVGKIPVLPEIRRISGRTGILAIIIVVVLQIFNEPRSGEVKNLFSFCKTERFAYSYTYVRP